MVRNAPSASAATTTTLHKLHQRPLLPSEDPTLKSQTLKQLASSVHTAMALMLLTNATKCMDTPKGIPNTTKVRHPLMQSLYANSVDNMVTRHFTALRPPTDNNGNYITPTHCSSRHLARYLVMLALVTLILVTLDPHHNTHNPLDTRNNISNTLHAWSHHLTHATQVTR
jgi:hypothetical protein